MGWLGRSRAALGGLVGGVGLIGIAGLAACTADASDGAGTTTNPDNEVKVDTRSPEARRQYDANVAFVSRYKAACSRGTSTRPRVLVTGFGRFMRVANNATGRIVSALVPAVKYPETEAPAPGEVDPPAAQLAVAQSVLDVPGIGEVDVCAMILPVYWDLAAILIAKEAQAFEPSMVLMNGVAGERQPLWIELGATNRAAILDDGSNQLRPAVGPNDTHAKIVETASESEQAQGNLLSWRTVEAAASEAIDEHAEERDGDERFGDIVHGVKLAGFPRSSNTYLCNNVTYVTGWLMSHPRREIRLLRATPAVPGKPNAVPVKIAADLSHTPRVFVHWPSALAEKHHDAAADVMRRIIGAQLGAAKREPATLGDNVLADPSLVGGDFF